MPKLLVNIDVDDLGAAVAFYTEGLALTVGRRLGPDVVELLGAEIPIYLLRKASGTSPFADAPARDYARHWTPVHLDFVVADLMAALSRVRGAGATLESPVSEHTWGKLALLSDPFGHGICLLEFQGRGYDALVTE